MGGKGRSEEYVLSEGQLQQLWKNCYELKDKVLVGLLGYMGMRAGEAAHFRSDWVKEEAIHIPASMPCHCNECWNRGYWKPKSKAGARIIPIPRFLKPGLVDYLRSSPDGLQMSRQAIWYRIQQLAEKAKLPKTFPHSLRATAATTLASKRFTGMERCAFMGWARIDVAESYVRIAQARAGVEKKMKEIYG